MTSDWVILVESKQLNVEGEFMFIKLTVKLGVLDTNYLSFWKRFYTTRWLLNVLD